MSRVRRVVAAASGASASQALRTAVHAARCCSRSPCCAAAGRRAQVTVDLHALDQLGPAEAEAARPAPPTARSARHRGEAAPSRPAQALAGRSAGRQRLPPSAPPPPPSRAARPPRATARRGACPADRRRPPPAVAEPPRRDAARRRQRAVRRRRRRRGGADRHGRRARHVRRRPDGPQPGRPKRPCTTSRTTAPQTESDSFNVMAYAAGTPEDPSTPRRLSLSRALAVRRVLMADGVASARIYRARARAARRWRRRPRRTASTSRSAPTRRRTAGAAAVTRPTHLPDPHGWSSWSPVAVVAGAAVAACCSTAFGNNPLLEQPDPAGAAARHRLEPAPGAAPRRPRSPGSRPASTRAARLAALPPPRLLAPMASMLAVARIARSRDGERPLHALRARRCAACSTASPRRLDESRELSRYMTGLLIFLGLLGTFWGLLLTVGAVSRRDRRHVGRLGRPQRAVRAAEVRPGPAAARAWAPRSPPRMFGLAGALVLGFLDLTAGQAQNRFFNELEEWLAGLTRLSSGALGRGRGLGAGLRPGAAGADRREHGGPAAHPGTRRGRPRAGQPGGAGADRAHRDAVGHDAHQPAAHAAHRRDAGGARPGAAAAGRAAARPGLRRRRRARICATSSSICSAC